MDVGRGSNEDDLTVKLQEIIQVNFALKAALSKGSTKAHSGTLPTIERQQGRFRGSLSGKRVDFPPEQSFHRIQIYALIKWVCPCT
jgi:DNA-directed RNA polymerase III subunit RPC1